MAEDALTKSVLRGTSFAVSSEARCPKAGSNAPNRGGSLPFAHRGESMAKNVVITGASEGIGRATAHQFAAPTQG